MPNSCHIDLLDLARATSSSSLWQCAEAALRPVPSSLLARRRPAHWAHDFHRQGGRPRLARQHGDRHPPGGLGRPGRRAADGDRAGRAARAHSSSQFIMFTSSIVCWRVLKTIWCFWAPLGRPTSARCFRVITGWYVTHRSRSTQTGAGLPCGCLVEYNSMTVHFVLSRPAAVPLTATVLPAPLSPRVGAVASDMTLQRKRASSSALSW